MTRAAFSSAPWRALLVSAGALAAYALAANIPAPGVDVAYFQSLQTAPIGATARLSIAALGVTPILSALYLIELLKTAAPPFRRYAERAEGLRVLRRILFGLSLAFVFYQAKGVALGYEGVAGLVEATGAAFRFGVIATFVLVTAFLFWLSSVATRRGLAQGFWLLVLAPTLYALPDNARAAFQLYGDGALAPTSAALAVAFLFAAIAALVFAGAVADDDAAPKRVVAFDDVWPALLAAPVAGIIALLAGWRGGDVAGALGGPLHVAALCALIAFFGARRHPDEAAPVLWTQVAAQSFACVGALLISARGGALLPFDGASLVVFVALCRDARKRWRAAGAVAE